MRWHALIRPSNNFTWAPKNSKKASLYNKKDSKMGSRPKVTSDPFPNK